MIISDLCLCLLRTIFYRSIMYYWYPFKYITSKRPLWILYNIDALGISYNLPFDSRKTTFFSISAPNEPYSMNHSWNNAKNPEQNIYEKAFCTSSFVEYGDRRQSDQANDRQDHSLKELPAQNKIPCVNHSWKPTENEQDDIECKFESASLFDQHCKWW